MILKNIQSWLTKKVHRHEWHLIYSSRWGSVSRCACTQFQTTMYDYHAGEPVTLPGNLLATAYSEPIFILCGNREEYREAVAQLQERMLIGETALRFLYSPDQIQGWIIPPRIVLWGTWWENDVCQTEALRLALNGWL